MSSKSHVVRINSETKERINEFIKTNKIIGLDRDLNITEVIQNACSAYLDSFLEQRINERPEDKFAMSAIREVLELSLELASELKSISSTKEDAYRAVKEVFSDLLESKSRKNKAFDT